MRLLPIRLAAERPSTERVYRSIRAKGGSTPRGSRPSHGRASTETFGCGDSVKQSGIYEVLHDGEHRTAHDVVMLAGDAFPPCETCDQKVRFRLVRTAPYIFQDADFEEEQ
jgi:hypothetical protein